MSIAVTCGPKELDVTKKFVYIGYIFLFVFNSVYMKFKVNRQGLWCV